MIKTTIVGFGDSLTNGYGVSKNVSYIDRLERYMPQYYPSISWNIYNKGVNGDTTAHALKRLTLDVLKYNPNIVFLLFGTNDCSIDHALLHTQVEFEENMRQMITKIKSHNNRTGLNDCIPIPVIITIPPVVEQLAQPILTNNRIKQYNYILKRLAEKLHCPMIDFHQYLEEESEGELVAYFHSDGIHLSIKGYDCLYDCVFSGLTKLITYEGILKDYDVKASIL